MKDRLYNLILAIAIVIIVAAMLGSANFQKVQGVTVDDGSHALVTVNNSEHEMNEGNHYFIKTWFEDTGGDDNVTYFAFITPDSDIEINAKAVAAPDVDFVIEIFEDAAITGGTPLAGVNNDRNSSNTAELVAVAAPTVPTPGNLIWAARNGGGRNPVGVSPAFNYKIIAKRNSTYVFKITKKIVTVGIVDIDFWWSEATDIE